MNNDFFLLNAFTGEGALGNQACVLFVEELANDNALHSIARDFSLPATTFLKQLSEDEFEVRWIAPDGEIDLCGHGTLAATWVLTQHLSICESAKFHFATGTITGRKAEHGKVSIQFDAIDSEEALIPAHFEKAFGVKPLEYRTSDNKHLVVFENEVAIRAMKPDWDEMRKSPVFSYAVTAPGKDYDFVSRVLLPHISILEDQATGSAHLVLAPYWSKRLMKSKLRAFQASRRGGEIHCHVEGGTVTLTTHCKLFGHGRLDSSV